MTTDNPTLQSEKLEPCPWCSVVPAMQWHTQEDEMGEGRYLYLVECGNGKCPMGLISTGGPYRTAEDAAKRWNSRAPVVAPQEARLSLKELTEAALLSLEKIDTAKLAALGRDRDAESVGNARRLLDRILFELRGLK